MDPKIEWTYTKDRNPHAWERGNWDGLKSDMVLCQDWNGKTYLAVLYAGFLDGAEYEDWYCENDYLISGIITRWMYIPD